MFQKKKQNYSLITYFLQNEKLLSYDQLIHNKIAYSLIHEFLFKFFLNLAENFDFFFFFFF